VSDGPPPDPIEPGPEAPSGSVPPLATEASPETPPHETAEPGTYHLLKWSTFLVALLPVWIAAATAGVGLYYWWFHTMDKTWPVFVVVVFVIGCTVTALLLAMAAHRPLIAALAIAVLTAPFAATAGAAPLHGTYYCEKSNPPIRCLWGVLPY
jgi:hypothetical protein